MTESTNKTDSGNAKELTKLERNLRRFEEERRRFELEKKKFDKEKRDLELARYKRFEEVERKRTQRKIEELKQQTDVHEKLYSILRVIEDSKNHLPSILKSEHKSHTNNQGYSAGNSTDGQTSLVNDFSQRDDSLEFPDESPDVCDDYESSTALSSSSREGDFDDEDYSSLTLIKKNVHNKPSEITQQCTPAQSVVIKNGTATNAPTEILVVSKPSFLGMLFGRKPKTVIKPVTPIQERLPSTGPVTFRRFFFVETRLVWRKLLADHPDEWDATMRMRNKCIADLIILTMFCGFGGMIFRFVEGAFENFYKCGVRRVKRDFVDHLWHTSHNLRLCLFMRVKLKY